MHWDEHRISSSYRIALKFFTALDDNNKESSACSKQGYVAVNLELILKLDAV